MADLKISQLTSVSTPLAGTEVVPLVQSSTTKKVSVANLTAGRTVDVATLLANSTSVDGNWRVQTNASASGLAGIGVNNNGGYGAYLIYDNSGRYAGGGAAIRNIANTPIYVETNNTIIGQFTTAGNYKPIAGKGIDFSADSHATGMTSQLLNWYEEGTWTPVLSRVTGGAITATTSDVTARYIRIGNQVTITLALTIDAVTSQGTGSNYISGLPFVPASNFSSAGSLFRNSAFTTSVVVSCNAWSDGKLYFHDAVNTLNLTDTDWQPGYVNLSYVYFV